MLFRSVSQSRYALLLNWLLPDQMGDIVGHVQTAIVHDSIWDMLWAWCRMAFFLVLKMSAIVSGLMFLQAVLKEFKILDVIARLFAPFMKLMGLSRDSSFLWFWWKRNDNGSFRTNEKKMQNDGTRPKILSSYY